MKFKPRISLWIAFLILCLIWPTNSAFTKRVREGALIKGSGFEVYVIKKGQRLHIPDEETFNILRFRWKKVLQIDDATLEQIPLGAALPRLRNGDLIKGSRPKVYLIKENRKCHIRDQETFEALGYRWEQVKQIEDWIIGKIRTGSSIKRETKGRSSKGVREGALIKGSGFEVYVIKKGQRLHIPDEETFNILRFRWKKVLQIDDATLEQIPLGSALPRLRNGDLIKGSRPKVYLIKENRKCHIRDQETFEALGYRWEQVKQIEDWMVSKIRTGSSIKREASLGEKIVRKARQYTTKDPLRWGSGSETYCLKFVSEMFRVYFGKKKAIGAYYYLRDKNKIRTGRNPPLGSVIFYDKHSENDHCGHVGICSGRGKLISVTTKGVKETRIWGSFRAAYLGYVVAEDYQP